MHASSLKNTEKIPENRQSDNIQAGKVREIDGREIDAVGDNARHNDGSASNPDNRENKQYSGTNGIADGTGKLILNNPPLCSPKTGHNPGPNLDALENSLGYSFKNRNLLFEALTHRSFFHENSSKSLKYNERMEFLGDAVLGLAISEILYNGKVFLTDAEMSKLKSFLVSRETLCRIAISMDVGLYMRLGKGEEMTEGRSKTSLLANTLEAVFGAIILDSDYESTKRAIHRLYEKLIEKVTCEHSFCDCKTTLQELTQTLFSALPDYRLSGESGRDHSKTFTYNVYVNGQNLGTGSGKSKKSAQMQAAYVAIDNLKKEKIGKKA
ncbi:MAG: ribonuclease III [Nitrospirae bacterium]|nr:ribonuclease III [Nitrospirota bacterium]